MIAYSGGVPAPERTGPLGTAAPLLTTSSPTAAISGSAGSAIHGAEKVVEAMKIYDGTFEKIQLVIDVVDTVVEVCTASLLVSSNGTTLAI